VANGESMMQVPDTNAEVLPVEILRRELARGGAYSDCVQRYSRGLHMLMMQSTACMALHSVHERGCRWLLMTHDRVQRDHFHLSHEFLAMMLGATRPTVTVVAGTLQKAFGKPSNGCVPTSGDDRHAVDRGPSVAFVRRRAQSLFTSPR
jgi:hypothetical protein